VRVYTPQGSFVRQYGDGDSRGIEYVPGDRLWSGGAGTTVRIFDTDSGAQVGSFTANGQTMSYSMQYSPAENTVLVVDADRDLGGVFELDLSGALLEQFHVPVAQTNCYSATRGPDGHVFGTTGDRFIDIVDWFSNGTVARTLDVYPNDIGAVRILWAGQVPEPGTTTFVAVGIPLLFVMRPSRSRRPA
jgi:WD40 repeat protein